MADDDEFAHQWMLHEERIIGQRSVVNEVGFEHLEAETGVPRLSSAAYAMLDEAVRTTSLPQRGASFPTGRGAALANGGGGAPLEATASFPTRRQGASGSPWARAPSVDEEETPAPRWSSIMDRRSTMT